MTEDMSKIARLASRRVQIRGREVNALYEDTIPSGSTVGTVIAYHGSPGSNDDFKYIRAGLEGSNIRFIGLNYPGFGLTESYESQEFTNEERQLYTNTLIDELGISKKIVCIGHSRGCENALFTAVEKDATGLVLISPIGVRPHKGVRPVWLLNSIFWLAKNLPTNMAAPFVYKLYKISGFRVKNEEMAMNSLLTMSHTAIEKQIPYIQKLNENRTKVFITYGGKDHLTEPEVIDEALDDEYRGIHKFKFAKEIDEQTVLAKIAEEIKGVAVLVDSDSHFQNKTRAGLIADAIKTILCVEKSKL